MTTDQSNKPPFERRVVADEPGILGTQWWQESLNVADTEARRQALKALVTMTAAAGVIAGVASLADDDEREEDRDALTLQRERGWNYGSQDEKLDFPNASGPAPSREDAASLANDLSPAVAIHQPHYVPTLFQVLTPSGTGDALAASNLLLSSVRPIHTGEMDTAQRAGGALADVLRGVDGMLVVVDLPGPLSVAWALGMAASFDPIFVFENWPHPRGVVPSHHTLGAALHCQTAFKEAALGRSASNAVMVLDRNRLNPVQNSTLQFDNRYTARMPTPASLDAMGVKHVLYVSQVGGEELDDLNEVLVDWVKSGRTVKTVAASDFWAEPSSGRFFYGGTAYSHEGFCLHHTWGRAAVGGAIASTAVSTGYSYAPALRRTIFFPTRVGPAGYMRERPPAFAVAPVVVTNGTVAGPRYGTHAYVRTSFFRFHSYSSG